MNTIQTTEDFDDWLRHLRDKLAAASIKMRLRRAEFGHFGDSKPIHSGLFEMRIHIGPGYRIYYKRVDLKIYILLAGGNKSTQTQDINLAVQLAQELE
jgi:putative addiction module killer protein